MLLVRGVYGIRVVPSDWSEIQTPKRKGAGPGPGRWQFTFRGEDLLAAPQPGPCAPFWLRSKVPVAGGLDDPIFSWST